MLTTAWDENKLSETEIDAMEMGHKAQRAQRRRFSVARVGYWYLDRRLFKGLRNGESLNDARENAIIRWGWIQGLVVGATVMLIVAAALLQAYGAATAGNYLQVVFDVGVWGFVLLAGSGLLFKWWRRVWRKIRREK